MREMTKFQTFPQNDSEAFLGADLRRQEKRETLRMFLGSDDTTKKRQKKVLKVQLPAVASLFILQLGHMNPNRSRSRKNVLQWRFNTETQKISVDWRRKTSKKQQELLLNWTEVTVN